MSEEIESEEIEMGGPWEPLPEEMFQLRSGLPSSPENWCVQPGEYLMCPPLMAEPSQETSEKKEKSVRFVPYNSPTKKSSTKKSSTKKSPAKKSPTKKSPTKKSPKKTPTNKSPTKKSRDKKKPS